MPDGPGLKLEGALIGVVTSEGRRVGFAGFRFPLQLRASVLKLHLKLKFSRGLLVRAIFKTQNSSVPGVEGALTYQVLLGQEDSAGLIPVQLSEAEPIVRGREIGSEKMPRLISSDIQCMGLELCLSDQSAAQNSDPIPFEVIWRHP